MTSTDVRVSDDANLVSAPRDPRGDPRVCAIVVAYRPDLGLLREVIRAATHEADAVLVIDNTEAGGTTVEPLSPPSGEGPPGTGPDPRKVHWVQNGSNVGLPKAYNQGLSWALSQGYDFVLLLDQDSILTKGALPHLLLMYRHLARESEVGCVSARNVEMEPIDFPVSRVVGVGLLSERLPPKSATPRSLLARLGIEERRVFTNSGTLLPLSVVQRCGPFNPALFLNAVDFDLSLALRSHGFHLYRCPGAEVVHRLSTRQVLRVLGVRVPVRVSAPWRSYLQIRDTVLFAKRWWRQFPQDVVRVLGETLVTTFGMLVLLDHRTVRLRWVLRGISDAADGSLLPAGTLGGPG